uniref:Uncharacterized protein n=1 Tax=Romanomermis culicivorax TaxID=13658 RepID=A0A915IZJ6_ROMCU
MQTKQPNLKSTQFSANVIIILLRAGGHPSKEEVKMGVTCQPLGRSSWYLLCPTTITGVGPGQTILSIDKGGGLKAQAPACSPQALENPLGVSSQRTMIGLPKEEYCRKSLCTQL